MKLTEYVLSRTGNTEHVGEVEANPSIEEGDEANCNFQCILSRRLTPMIVDYLFIVKFNRGRRGRRGIRREGTGRRIGRMKDLREHVGGRRMRGEGKGEEEK